MGVGDGLSILTTRFCSILYFFANLFSISNSSDRPSNPLSPAPGNIRSGNFGLPYNNFYLHSLPSFSYNEFLECICLASVMILCRSSEI